MNLIFTPVACTKEPVHFRLPRPAPSCLRFAWLSVDTHPGRDTPETRSIVDGS